LTEANFKYRAFLSYSHADAAVAKRVHARLEGFRINKNDFAGRSGLAAPTPATLRPIFRDRSDWQARPKRESGLPQFPQTRVVFIARPR
jgi:hypothetical protein